MAGSTSMFETREVIPGHFRKFWFRGNSYVDDTGVCRVSIDADHIPSIESTPVESRADALQFIMDQYQIWLRKMHADYARAE